MPYIPMDNTFIPNTTMKKFINSAGNHTQYVITPNENYVLHDKDLDVEEINPETFEPTGNIILGFYEGDTSVRYDYDFTANPREFYAVLITEVPENSEVFNVEPDHEVM